jgi:hypothetical protein
MPACRDQAVARASQSIAHRCGLPAKIAEKTILTCGVRIFLTGIEHVVVSIAPHVGSSPLKLVRTAAAERRGPPRAVTVASTGPHYGSAFVQVWGFSVERRDANALCVGSFKLNA